MSGLYGNFSAKTAQESVINVLSSAWTALPTTALAGRQYMEIFNKSGYKLYLSFDNTVGVKYRAAIAAGDLKGLAIQDNLTLYGRSGGAGSARVIVTEYK